MNNQGGSPQNHPEQDFPRDEEHRQNAQEEKSISQTEIIAPGDVSRPDHADDGANNNDAPKNETAWPSLSSSWVWTHSAFQPANAITVSRSNGLHPAGKTVVLPGADPLIYQSETRPWWSDGPWWWTSAAGTDPQREARLHHHLEAVHERGLTRSASLNSSFTEESDLESYCLDGFRKYAPCCLGCCTMCTCTSGLLATTRTAWSNILKMSTRSAFEKASTSNRRSYQPVFDDDPDDDNTARIRRKMLLNSLPHAAFLGLGLSLMLFSVLIAVSGVKHNWMLQASETRRVFVPMLTREIVLSSADDALNRGIVSFYYYEREDCPPLTGPTLLLENSRGISWEEGGIYQYDYFFLNIGSTIEINVEQISGASGIYVLRGERELDRIQGDTHGDEGDFGRSALIEQHPSRDDGPTAVNLTWDVQRNDVFTIVYDNASGKETRINVHYEVTVTTYILKDVPPFCDLEPGLGKCVLRRPLRDSCLLVQGPPVSGGSSPEDGYGTVRIQGKRRWVPLLLFSSVPFLLGWLVSCWSQRRASHNNGSGAQPVSCGNVGRVQPMVPPTIVTDQKGVPSRMPASAHGLHVNYSSIPAVPITKQQATKPYALG